MEIIWLGIQLAIGLAIGYFLIRLVIRIVREVIEVFLVLRFRRAGCTYQPGEVPGTPSGWLTRDIRNDDWLFWDEKNLLTLRTSDDADPAETWQISGESLREFLRLARKERKHWGY